MTKIKLLIVDDELEFAATLAERMELRGIETQIANTGQEALEKVYFSPPDVVILDLKMPDMNGLEVLQGIKALHPSIEVIMLTGHGSTASGIESKEKGAFDYIMKPVDLTELLEKLKLAYEKRSKVEK
ncbi:MAG: response regulator [Proteobacteria bacterium]|jgi:DNA-binding NtrC family response regulator|nr:response regulator [Desulfocapsa sp.]MBU3943282.1 response regulator [Pseudomonadota bacterium]MCG2744450.1 response regulator [Desulfobacteraceae bacterium]MDO8945561.1 response regulator [Desulfocapsaceae bacterium]MBU3983492.1 response regulator [Pseudomonadota bacterium]